MINQCINNKQINNKILRKRTYSFGGVPLNLNKTKKDVIQLRKASSNHETLHMRKTSRQRPQQNKTKTESLKTLTYNKWFIKPSNRLKKSVQFISADKTRDQYYYKDLFRPQYPDPECPFVQVTNEKVKLLQTIPKHNITYLEVFRNVQMGRKKRVPQIIEMLVKRKQNHKLRFNGTK